MNKKVPITKPIHPKFIIQHVISSAVRRIYQYNWTPRVVRQKARVVLESKLTFLDYAVPCFELAQIINKPVDEVTASIISDLNYTLNLEPNSDFFKYLKFEGINGYINFELEKTYITNAILYSLAWLQKPVLLYDVPATDILTFGYGIALNAELETVKQTLAVLSELKSAVVNLADIHYLISDRSEMALTELLAIYLSQKPAGKSQVEGVNPANNDVLDQRQLKNIISVDQASDVLGNPKLFIDQMFKRNPLMYQIAETRHLILSFESQLYGRVNEFLDHSISSCLKDQYVVYDEASKAIYYTNEQNIVSLRSASGYIFSSAFYLYLLSSLKNSPAKQLLIIAPQNTHAGLREWFDILQFKSLKSLTVFDPKASTADLEELNKNFENIMPLFNKIMVKLEVAQSQNLLNAGFRQNILAIIDFPLDLNNYLAELQLPALFDLMNQIGQTFDDN